MPYDKLENGKYRSKKDGKVYTKEQIAAIHANDKRNKKPKSLMAGVFIPPKKKSDKA